LHSSEESPIFDRNRDFVRFNQSGRKLVFPEDVSDDDYYMWLDSRISDIGRSVVGGSIIERETARLSPRKNSGVYYDTASLTLLGRDMVLRTTSNPRTHAFCAFKLGEDSAGVRRDHRHIFDGEDKTVIQNDPSGPAAVAAVKRLLFREDIMHPGRIMREMTGIEPDDVFPVISLIQYRRTFYVLLDGRDALRCSLDRAEVRLLRDIPSSRADGTFSEVEVPIYPRIAQEVAQDPRLSLMIGALCDSLIAEFGCRLTTLSKYRRGMQTIGLFDPPGQDSPSADSFDRDSRDVS
jgi:hypothetical protein